MPIEPPGFCPTINFLDVAFADLSFAAAVELVLSLDRTAPMMVIVTPNVDHINQLNARPKSNNSTLLNSAYDLAILRLCDSRVLAAIARVLGLKIPVVPGSDLLAALVQRQFGGARHITLIGGDDTTLDQLKIILPEIELVQHVPPMAIMSKPDAIDAVVEFVDRNPADFTLFAIGCPQSEILAARCAQSTDSRGISLCIGASIDFILGKQKRAPLGLQRLGLEWAYRLYREPRRMWRRYLADGPQIFVTAAKWYWRNRAGKAVRHG